MKNEVRVASIVNILANISLFFIKIIVGLIFGSISILSDAINSLSDIVVAVIIFFTIKINNKEPDPMHPFGHTRAENIAGYTTGMFMILLGFWIMGMSIKTIVNKTAVEYSYLMMIVVLVTLVVKLGLYAYIKNVLKRNNSPSLKANLHDHLNDVIIIIGVLIAVLGLMVGLWWLDPLIGLLIAIYVIRGGWKIAFENIDHLMGKSADERIIDEIKKKALGVKEVKGLNDVFTQYLGNKIQVEIHIEVSDKLNIKKAHDIGNQVKREIESMEDINNCFVHIDVYDKNRKIKSRMSS